MQQKRFQASLEIIHCDGFISMPATAQALYIQILSVCDDEGFTSQLGMCKYMAHAEDDDVKTLVDREFIILVGERKVCLVKHWAMNVWLRNKSKSTFAERSLVYVKPNGNYTLDSTKGTPLEQQERNSSTAVEQSSRGDAPTQGSAQTPPRRSNPNQSNTLHSITGQGKGRADAREEDDDEPF
ncbi:MAG: hypothetical protein IJS52_10485 [Bacilli bacterium]|nr:hypothetical protein [Bacilli bacterium]